MKVGINKINSKYLSFLLFFLLLTFFYSISTSVSGNNYWKIKITVTNFTMDDNLDWPFKMKIGFTFYIDGYQDNLQFCVFTLTEVKKDTIYYNLGSYTTPWGYPTNAKVVWLFYEDDSNPLNIFNSRDDLAVFAGGGAPFIFYVTGTHYTWKRHNPDDHGTVNFYVDFILTGIGPPE